MGIIKILPWSPSRSSQKAKVPSKGFTEEKLMKGLLPEVWPGMKEMAEHGEAPGAKGGKPFSAPESAGAKKETLRPEPTGGATWQNTATAQTLTGKGQVPWPPSSCPLISCWRPLLDKPNQKPENKEIW